MKPSAANMLTDVLALHDIETYDASVSRSDRQCKYIFFYLHFLSTKPCTSTGSKPQVSDIRRLCNVNNVIITSKWCQFPNVEALPILIYFAQPTSLRWMPMTWRQIGIRLTTNNILTRYIYIYVYVFLWLVGRLNDNNRSYNDKPAITCHNLMRSGSGI